MIYKFPSYVPGIAIAVAVVAAIVGGLFIWRRQPIKRILLAFGVALVSGGFLAPILALDHVVLDEEKLEQTTGFWFAPTVKGFRFAETAYVTIDVAFDRKNREYEVWIVTLKSGGERIIDPGDLWVNNGSDIIRRLRAKGIEVRP